MDAHDHLDAIMDEAPPIAVGAMLPPDPNQNIWDGGGKLWTPGALSGQAYDVMRGSALPSTYTSASTISSR